MADKVRSVAVGIAAYARAGVQKAVGRERTAAVGRWIGLMYREQPLLLGLLLTWTAFVALPIAAFAGYAALWAAVALGVFWAIFLFWAGLGLLVFLVPAVCVATGLSLAVFAWAAMAYYLVGAWVLSLCGYDSLDAALGVSSTKAAPSSVAPKLTPTAGTVAPAHPPAYYSAPRDLSGVPYTSAYADAKGAIARPSTDTKTGEKEALYANDAALGNLEKAS